MINLNTCMLLKNPKIFIISFLTLVLLFKNSILKAQSDDNKNPDKKRIEYRRGQPVSIVADENVGLTLRWIRLKPVK